MDDQRIVYKEQFQDFFSSQGLIYLQRPIMDWKEHDQINWIEQEYYRLNQLEFEISEKNFSSEIKLGYLCPLSLRYISEDVGWGLFSEVDLEPGDFVGEYTGRIQLAREILYGDKPMPTWESDFAWNYPCELPDGTELEINARLEGNVLRYANHSFQPNCTVDHTLVEGYWVTFFEAKEKILKGSQLTVDYGEEYWADGHRTLIIL